ncbi:relaxase domain-containing protein [Streptomyces achromogenes]|uniref:Relaxase domain-containing protein n=1 Tax=Streptomyces achromogenes TaxID=67255 RepID=A0ABZ1L361_STRAH
MEIAGIDRRLICWQSTRRQQIEDALPVLTARYEEKHGHAPGERASYALACQAAAQTRPPKRTELRSLTELRTRWRTSATRAFGACTVYRLAQRARAAAAAVWARVRPMVDTVLAAVDVVAVVCVMRGAFARHHLLAEARRHLSYVLHGRPHQPGLDEQIVEAVVDDYTRPVGRRMMTADLRALYPHETEDQAVLRPLTHNRTAPPYERARLAAGALAARVHAVRRADRLGSRTRPRTVAVPAASGPRPQPLRTGRKAGHFPEQETGVDTVEQTRRTLEAVAAELQDGVRERAVTFGPRPRPGGGPTATHRAARHPAHTGSEPQRRSRVSTPEERPNPEAALARAQAARARMAAALDNVQGPRAAESLGWQPVWKRSRKPKSKTGHNCRSFGQHLPFCSVHPSGGSSPSSAPERCPGAR